MFIVPVILEPSRRTTNAADEAAEPADEGQQAFGDLFSKVLGKSISTDTHAPGGARKQAREEMQGRDGQEPMLEPEAQSESSEPAGPVDEVHLSSESNAGEEGLQASEAEVETAGEVQSEASKAGMQWMLAGELIVPPEPVSTESAVEPAVMMLDAEGRIVPPTGEESNAAQQVQMARTMTTASSMPEEPPSSSNTNSAPVQTGEVKVELQSTSSAESAEQPVPEAHVESEPSAQKSELNLKNAQEPTTENKGTRETVESSAGEQRRTEPELRPEDSSGVQKGIPPKQNVDLSNAEVEAVETVEPETQPADTSASGVLEDVEVDAEPLLAGPKPDPSVTVAQVPRDTERSSHRPATVDVKPKDADKTARFEEKAPDVETRKLEVEVESADAPEITFAESAEQETARLSAQQGGRSGRTPAADAKIHQAELDVENAARAARTRPAEPQQNNAETGKEDLGQATNAFRNSAAVRVAARSAQSAKTFLHQVLVQSVGRAPLEGGMTRPENVLAHAEAFASTFDRIEKLQELMDHIDQHVLSLAVGSEKTMTITLVPESLGKVVMNCRENNGQMVVEIQVSNAGVKDMLQKQEDSLRQMLEQNGYKLAQFDVKTQNDNSRDHHRSAARADRDGDDEFELARRPRAGAVSGPAASAPSQGRGIWYVA